MIWPLIYPRDLIFSWHWDVAIDGYSHSHLKELQRNGIWGIFLVYDEGNMCWHGSPCFCNSKDFVWLKTLKRFTSALLSHGRLLFLYPLECVFARQREPEGQVELSFVMHHRQLMILNARMGWMPVCQWVLLVLSVYLCSCKYVGLIQIKTHLNTHN